MTTVWRVDLKAWKICEMHVAVALFPLLLEQTSPPPLFKPAYSRLSLCFLLDVYLQCAPLSKDIMIVAVLEWIGKSSSVTLSGKVKRRSYVECLLSLIYSYVICMWVIVLYEVCCLIVLYTCLIISYT
jgi:hypothetical protein